MFSPFPVLKLLMMAGILALSAATAVAQSPVTATVDRDAISTDETVTLSITITGSGASRPTLPDLDGFQVVGTSSASQFSIVNGAFISQATYRFILQPTRAGELTIPAITVSVGGQSYTTDPITVTVAQGSGQGSGQGTASPPADSGEAAAPGELSGQDFFVEAEVDNPTPYLGQQVVYTFRFYQAVSLLGQPGYDSPDFVGFWNQQGTQQQQYTVRVSGRTYRVTALQTILFPTSAGEHIIEPAVLQLPGSLFQAGRTLRSEPVTVTVRPLPDPTPDGFSGAVGQLNITATAEPTSVVINEPVTLRVTVSGQGNIETLPDPALPEPAGWRAFESTSLVNTQLEDGRLTGSRVYEQLLVPTEAGTFTIPAIPYAYFDPEAGAYRTVTTEPLTVIVAEGVADTPIPAVPGVAQETVAQLETDIRHIKPVPPVLESAPAPLPERPSYWLMWLLPVLAIAVDWAWQRRQAFRAQNPGLVRRSQAHKKARRILSRARKQALDPHTAVAQALTGYLGDKLDLPVSGMTQAALAAELEARQVDDALLSRLQALLAWSEMGRFAPVSRDGETAVDAVQDAEKLIAALERVL